MDIEQIFDEIAELIGDEGVRSLYLVEDKVILNEYAVDANGYIYKDVIRGDESWYELGSVWAVGNTPRELAQSFLDKISGLK